MQFAILNALIDDPGEDRITLSGQVAFDAATSGSVIGGLEAMGWLRRKADASDKRRKLLWTTPEGEQATQKMKRAVSRAQQRIVSPLDARARTAGGAAGKTRCRSRIELTIFGRRRSQRFLFRLGHQLEMLHHRWRCKKRPDNRAPFGESRRAAKVHRMVFQRVPEDLQHIAVGGFQCPC